MRLYIKFFALVLAAASLQRFVFSEEPPSELWFGMRCLFAYTIHDKQMVNRLADEARRQNYYEIERVNARAGG